MEIVISKHKNFVRAYNALREGIDLLITKQNDPSVSLIDLRLSLAGTIKHFELAYETCWKFLKIYLEKKYGVIENSPKSVFRACMKVDLLTQETVDELIVLTDDRNETTHMYDEERAQEICESIEKHYKSLGVVLEKVKM